MTGKTQEKPKRGRGQPAYIPTSAARRKVSICKAGGMADQDIADGLGISRGTLVKHFERELTIGAIERRQELLESLHKQGKKGSVAAVRLFLQLNPILDPPPLPTDPEEVAPKGKKAKADADAQTAAAGTGWSGLLKPPAQIQ